MTGAGRSEARAAIRPMTPDDEPAYRAFCAATYGPSAYQGRSTYLRWLYDDSPLGRGIGDALLAIEADGTVVGCVHRMRLPWRIHGEVVDVPSNHNLMIAPSHRGGAGFFVLTAGVRGEEYALVPGVVDDMAELYTRLKYQRLGARWHRRVLRADRVVVQTVANRLGRPAPERVVPDGLEATIAGLRVTSRPDDATLERIARTLIDQATVDGPDVAHVAWTGPLLRWRYFAARGPRHALIRGHDDDTFAIVSIGPRRGVTVARLLAWAPAVMERSFLGGIKRIVERLGAAALLAFDAPATPRDTLAAAGWPPMASPPLTFLYAKDKQHLPVSLDAGATDLGFEGLPPEDAGSGRGRPRA
jgi:hypothetical protein